MNAFDQHVLLGLNQLARRWPALDQSANLIAHSNLFKGYVMVGVLVWYWCTGKDGTRRRNREIVLATAVAALLAVAIGKVLEGALPFRDRPVHDPTLGFIPPFGGSELILRGASAFPSDHATFFGALATGLWYVSPLAGIAAHLYAALVIYLPRVYVGFHHPTDLVAGAAIGIAIAVVANASPTRRWLAKSPLRWAERYPRLFIVALFLGALQFATAFLEAENLYSDARLVFCLARHEGAPDAVWARCTKPRTESSREVGAARELGVLQQSRRSLP